MRVCFQVAAPSYADKIPFNYDTETFVNEQKALLN